MNKVLLLPEDLVVYRIFLEFGIYYPHPQLVVGISTTAYPYPAIRNIITIRCKGG